MKKQLLVIDGYNVIGNWPNLNQMKLENRLADARDELLKEISEYKKYRELNVIVIFDAMYVPGLSKKDKHYNLDIIWTSKNETADSYIEAFVRKKQSRFLQVIVVTSDQAEQWTVFSAGALRLPARELLRDIKRAKTEIKHEVKSYKNQVKAIRNTITPDQMMILEKLRDDLSK
ncbi:NYN domain-containing protein [Apilactobacillus sp. TMW 2.2459]|uniref:NYN domain-containing protein n=1 Tax=Apilactobacillus xinyiensis TaxID=2841032 RepID=UPI0020109C71|nr:NYN domain-containing protein [Apilactobacillus xinyiensis]MCL0312698.1 NYN domain-containing protein [Apilactobacillus xinyiensis]MCL0330324.1 NYN domain-containing protein [Apilactobacillus xinyiensis]